MKIIETFEINTISRFEILIPEIENKINYYSQPTDSIHMSDEITILYKENDKNIVVFKDSLNEAIMTLYNTLNKALNEELQLPLNIGVGSLGYQYNFDSMNNKDTVNYSNFWLWSSNNIQTWLYNTENIINLEVSPSYPGLFLDLPVNSFGTFMDEYTPIIVAEIKKEIAIEWLKKCDTVLKTMIKD